jgi:hypothetical protein
MPDLAHTVDAEVRLEHTAYLNLQLRIPTRSRRGLGGIDTPRGMSMIGGRGDRQHRADRLDPVGVPVIVDKGDHDFERRSSSA